MLWDATKDALNYQKDVEGAREQRESGEARTEAIEAKRKEMKGSGLPAVDSPRNVQEPEEKKRQQYSSLSRKVAENVSN